MQGSNSPQVVFHLGPYLASFKKTEREFLFVFDYTPALEFKQETLVKK